ncbi:FAD:protein FMN transferase [Lentilactobacillus laojiaonis]|uniref:FAD:protein FMN transferase n=1 Tax=Lentilactobacillus laojiaonis TaxID=2883998 RepID=UPI001D0A6C17|nr:FAD:protein FMN transferase [Lentilactobacillus laojiaonis]UDM32334.1 FAD:protein FMN transferase [Lentilactobacillus laojiaonis]
MQKSHKLHLMGTIITITIEHADPEPILVAVDELLKEYEHRFSANDYTSELMQITKFAGKQAVKVDEKLYELIEIGKIYSQLPNSNLNIAIGPLVQTWRIGFKDARVPTDQEIQQKLQLTDPANIILDAYDKSVYLANPQMTIDLGALAKGFIADLIIEYLNQQQVKAALINLGGNIVALGNPVGRPYWQIGLQDPSQPRGHSLGTLKIKDQSIVTSGIYERHLEQNGKSYHHIFDVKTGYPIQTNVVSLTILSQKSIMGEVWTTILFGKPVTKILKIVNQLENIECIIVTDDGKVYQSNKELLK